MGQAQRRTSTTTVTNVRVVSEPFGPTRENGPHLEDLRNFVEACDGIPGSVVVNISNGSVNGSGRHDVELSLSWTHPMEEGS